MGVRYAHTNIIAHDWDALARFYETVLECVRLEPERDQAGEWLAKGTGVSGAALRGVHLRLPGHGKNGPTLEVYSYTEMLGKPAPHANRQGYGHLAFAVEDVHETLANVLAHGGRALGEVVTTAISGTGDITFRLRRRPRGQPFGTAAVELEKPLKNPLTVGVLGGLGPEATLDFYARVIALSPAARDQEHLHVIIDSCPGVPNRNEAVAGTGPSPGPALAAMARRLENAGADFLVMACNAAHAFQADIEAAVSVPFVSIIEETVRATMKRCPGVQTVGVLGSSGCLDAQLYQTAFAGYGVEVVVPESAERENFMTLLYRIKAGDKGDAVYAAMQNLAEMLVAKGAQAVVAGCTEVPLVLGQDALRVPLVDSSAVLAERTVFYATYGLTPSHPPPSAR